MSEFSPLPPTTGLCAGVALVFRPPVTAARLCTKDKYLEPMFGDVGQARTNAAMLLLMIDTTSSHTCTKPIVACWRFLSIEVNFFQRKSPNRHNLHCILWQVPTNELRKCPHYLNQPCLLFLCGVYKVILQVSCQNLCQQ